MTSDHIEAYGGVVFPGALLRQFAEQLTGTDVPFHLDHDLTKPVRTRNVQVFVHDRNDGISELRFRGEIHADDTRFMDARPAVSATVMRPLARDELFTGELSSRVQLSADHAWFDDEALIDAEQRLLARGIPAEDLAVRRAYQFSIVPEPQIFVDIAYSLLLSVGAAALWDGIKLLFARRRTPVGGDSGLPTTINVDITDGNRAMRAVITTRDEEVAKRAINSVDNALTDFQQASSERSDASLSSPPTTAWDDSNQRWTPPS